MKNKKILALIAVLVVVVAAVAIWLCTKPAADENVIRIGATAAPHAEILNSDAVKNKMAEQGYTLEVVVYDGYVLENPAVSDGTDKANYFQHQPYLDSYNATVSEKDKLVGAFTVHYEPFGIYSAKIKDLSELPDGAKIGLPNDPSNETRAMLLLAAAGLIQVPEGANAESVITKYDITAEMNPHGYEFVEVNAELLPATLPDYAIAVINGNYAIGAGLKPATDALVLEASDSAFATLYANVVAVRAEDLDSEWLAALKVARTSEEARQYMMDTYAGGVVPTF